LSFRWAFAASLAWRRRSPACPARSAQHRQSGQKSAEPGLLARAEPLAGRRANAGWKKSPGCAGTRAPCPPGLARHSQAARRPLAIGFYTNWQGRTIPAGRPEAVLKIWIGWSQLDALDGPDLEFRLADRRALDLSTTKPVAICP
jgi:hypothetical protein